MTNRPAASTQVETELELAFRMLARTPRVGATARPDPGREIRRLLLPRIRYHVFYSVIDSRKTVEILALWHTSRGSEPPL
jgi:plasmid stabilization system protein ParE